MKISLKAVKKKNNKRYMHLKRRFRIRKKITGIIDKPRISVFRSINEIYVQAIDDNTGNTITSSSSLDESIKSNYSNLKKADLSRKVGNLLGERLINKGIKDVVFDRNGFRYRGRVASLADGIRESGLNF